MRNQLVKNKNKIYKKCTLKYLKKHEKNTSLKYY